MATVKKSMAKTKPVAPARKGMATKMMQAPPTASAPMGMMKKGGMMKKAKDGSSFGMLSVKAGIDKNPNPTFADKIAGAKKMAKSGTKMKMGGAMAKQAAIAIAMKKEGKTPKKKMQYGGSAASMVPKGAKKMKSGGTVSMELGSYGRQLGKNYSGKK